MFYEKMCFFFCCCCLPVSSRSSVEYSVSNHRPTGPGIADLGKIVAASEGGARGTVDDVAETGGDSRKSTDAGGGGGGGGAAVVEVTLRAGAIAW